MKKSELLKYIFESSNKKHKVVKEQYDDGVTVVSEITGTERRMIFKYLNTLKNSGITNMMNASIFLTYTRKDLKKYIDYHMDGKKDKYIKELLETQDDIRDILIRAAMQRLDDQNTNSGDDDSYLRNVQRTFEKISRECVKMWIVIL